MEPYLYLLYSMSERLRGAGNGQIWFYLLLTEKVESIGFEDWLGLGKRKLSLTFISNILGEELFWGEEEMMSSNLDFPSSEGLWDIHMEISCRHLDIGFGTL